MDYSLFGIKSVELSKPMCFIQRVPLISAAMFVALTVAAHAKADTFYKKDVKGGWIVLGQAWETEATCFATKSFVDGTVLSLVMNPGDPDGKITFEANRSTKGAEVPIDDIKKALAACKWRFERLYNE
ncbi:hypothetical protein [Bradyrhizobium japonicum]|uniref:Uncharacterized protein n=1 Tax=Bradyrhizobium japonicum TaxID=375 RepID=A0A1Y2JMQ3_BRAJP|nr:hypothetical protein [Bradyrhizobium japonicum]OSJ31964.1 hypothetical protein BSZ19_20385 [Bradyrhizobium japonicum]